MYLTGKFYNTLHLSMSVLKSKFIGLESLDGNIYVITYKDNGEIQDRLYIRPNISSTIRSSTKQSLKRFATTHGYHFIYAVYDSKCEHCKRRVQGEIDAYVGKNKGLF